MPPTTPRADSVEHNELAHFLINLRAEYGVTQEQLRDLGAKVTKTRPYNIGTIRNAEGDIRPIKLQTLLCYYYMGLTPRMSEVTWLKIVLLWALKKHAEAIEALEEDRQELAKSEGKPPPRSLGLKTYTLAEALDLLGLVAKEDESDKELARCAKALRKLRPHAIRLLTSLAEQNPDLLQQQLKVLQFAQAK